MKKIILLLPFLALLTFVEYEFVSSKYSAYGNKLAEIEINEKKFKVEIAESEKKKYLGLGDRNNLCSSCGMLFVFKEGGKHQFWMRGMNFPLDIIWISGNKIVYIAKNISKDHKGTITPFGEADKVLEINAGLCEKYGIEEGDEIKFKM